MQDPEMTMVFLDEFGQLLFTAIDSLSSLPKDKDQFSKKKYIDNVYDLFRVMHTMKGNSAYMDFRQLKKLSNSYCEFFRDVKDSEGNYLITSQQSDLILNCIKTMTRFKSTIKTGKNSERISVIKLIKAIDVERERIKE
ncbi:MAG: hypothetical protein ACXAEU_23340 [Candidatus Hodarchaeales archaeon]